MKNAAALLALAFALPGAGSPSTEIRGMKHPALSPDGKRIAFDWHGDLWVCRVEGGPAERLTDDPADEQKPAWSPDGTRLAYSSDAAGNRDLLVLDLATRKTHPLTVHSADDDSPAWSPDGRWVAFQSNRDSNLDLALNNNVWDVWKAPAAGGTATRVTRFRGENPAWSPDGKWIAYDRYASGYSDGEHNIFLIAPDGSGVPVEIAAGPEDSRHPTFRGTAVYFAHEANGIQASGFRNVWRTTTAGGALFQVTGHPGDHVTWPSTGASSDSLVYEFDFDLYTIDVRRPQPRKLSVTTGVAYDDEPVVKQFTSGFKSPAWSPSGARLAFSCRGDLWMAPVEGGEARALTNGLDEDREPDWSADGRTIVFCSGPAAMPAHVVTIDVKSGERKQRTKEPGAYRNPRLSPDGKRIVVARQQDEGADLWMIGESGPAPFAASRDVDESAGCFSPDGSSIAYLSSKGGKNEIVVCSSSGTERKRIDAGNGGRRGLTWSPDGTSFALLARQPQGRWAAQVVKSDGTGARTLPGNVVSASWSPDSTMLLCERDTETLVILDGKGGGETLPVKVTASRPSTRREEMLGVFFQVYGSYVGNYYDPFFHGVDMAALRDKYAPHAGGCRTKPELYELINDMIRELRSSHIHLTPAPVKNSVVTGNLGVDLSRDAKGLLLVARVEHGGPAEKAGIRAGDRIGGDPDRLLTGEALAEVALEIEGRGTVKVKGIDRAALRELKYENTIAHRKKSVLERSGGKLAYHHIKMMVMPEVQRLKSALEGQAAGAQGLVLDERDGVGGLAHRPVCSLLDSTAADRLNAHPACAMRNRNGTTVVDRYGQGQAGGRASGKSWDRPVVMIQNSISRSDKEILPYTFRHLGIGYLVGMPTAGGVIGGSDWTMQDGSKITVSIQGWFTLEGRNMEGWGVPPDFRVAETHEDLYAGRDAQLEKAVEVLLAQMDGRIAAPRRPGAQAQREKPAPTLEEHVRFLTGAALKGREAGSEGEKLAADYIEAQLKRAGIEVQIQEFDAHAGVMVRNVIGVIKGKSDEAVVLGAHYDHLGEIKGKVHPGADDNASGTAVLLQVAEKIAKSPPKRTIVIAAFSGEEFGAFGSRYYVNHPVVPLEKTVAMVNMDMVGRLGDKLIIFGADTGDKFRDLLADSAIPLVLNKDPGGQSDHTSFQMKSIPAVHFFTGSHADYHKPGDTADKINVEGMGKVATLVETLVRRTADGERMAFQKGAVPAPQAVPAKGATPYFGSAPDYGFEGKGVRLAGVNPGSPAETAGLKEGDVIVEFNGKAVEDVKSYSDKLYSCKPGDQVTFAYEREGKRSTAKATLGARKKNNDE
ncbi:MAG TPA: M28 family peptidase [Planctomycetota bacterium]|nr:M28 family peptidase [Planctomycetota bacterium]